MLKRFAHIGQGGRIGMEIWCVVVVQNHVVLYYAISMADLDCQRGRNATMGWSTHPVADFLKIEQDDDHGSVR